MSYPTQREKLVAEVVEQILADVESGDLTAVYELLSFIQSPTLYKYLEAGDMQ